MEDGIGRITTKGTVTNFPVPVHDSQPDGIATGADGSIWFTEYLGNKVARITPSGSITEYTIPTATSEPRGIALGPDGNLWFVEYNGNKIGMVTDAPSPSITKLSPSSGPPLTSVKVSSSGFGAEEVVTISFVDSVNGTTQLATVRTNLAGSFARRRVTIPGDATTGSQRIQVAGGASFLTASKTFTVT